MGTVLFGNYFQGAITVNPEHNPFLPEHYHGIWSFIGHGLLQPPFWLAMAGVGTAYYFYLVKPELPNLIAQRLQLVYTILLEKYGFDRFNDWFFAGGTRRLGTFTWQLGDVKVIDGTINGTARLVNRFSQLIRHLQSGLLYHYAFTMIIGLALLLGLFVF
jgi:NADH-quinone oxidoreductase subunit L